MKIHFIASGILVLLVLGSIGCASSASPEDIDQMCAHLAKLRAEPGGDADQAAAEEALDKCKSDPLITGVTQEVAKCRIAAPTVDAFWNKCR